MGQVILGKTKQSLQKLLNRIHKTEKNIWYEKYAQKTEAMAIVKTPQTSQYWGK